MRLDAFGLSPNRSPPPFAAEANGQAGVDEGDQADWVLVVRHVHGVEVYFKMKTVNYLLFEIFDLTCEWRRNGQVGIDAVRRIPQEGHGQGGRQDQLRARRQDHLLLLPHVIQKPKNINNEQQTSH